MRDATICEEELLQNIQVYTIGTIGIVGTVVEYCDDLLRGIVAKHSGLYYRYHRYCRYCS